jgi:hypothetical protein
MEFVLGILGILQITFLPGLIVLRLFNLRTNLLDKLLIIFGTSLISNYCIIFLLSLLGIYSRITLAVLILAELIAILWLYRRDLVLPVRNILEAMQDGVYEFSGLFFPRRQSGGTSVFYYLIVILLLLASARSILWAVNLFIQNLGTVFSAWDAVVSWNNWATIWAASKIPLGSDLYPQLVPANWSITYVLLGSTTLQFFAKAIMPLFALMILLGLFNLVLLTKEFYFLISIVLLQPLLKKFLNNGLYNGYVDIAVAFFTFAALYVLVKAHDTPDTEQRSRLYILGAIFTAGAAVSKQTGVYIALCYPILVIADVYFSKYPLDKKRLRTWISVFAAISLVWVSWYVFKSIVGTDPGAFNTYLSLSENKYENAGLFSRIAAAIGQNQEFIILFLLIVVTFPWMDRFYKVLTILFAPFPFIWAGVASYDTRNLAIFLPVLALVAGYSIHWLIVKLVGLSERVKALQIPVYIPVAFVCLALFTLGFLVSPQKLYQRQVDLQRQIFSPSKNQMLLDLVAENGPQTRIMTNYPMEYIPGLSEYQVRFDFQDYDIFLSKIQNPEIEYLLVPNVTDDQIKDYINTRVEAGDYQVIDRDKQWKVFTLIKILNRE